MTQLLSFIFTFFTLTLIAQPRLVDINPGSQSSYPEYFTEFNGSVYFRAYNPVSNKDVLYKTDGTLPGTQLVKDIAVTVSYPNQEFTQVNGLLIFSGYDPSYGWELWVSDGSSSGTIMLMDFITGPNSSSPEYLTPAGNLVYFQIHNTAGNIELWKSDGTVAGTNKVSDIEPAISNKPPQFCYCNGQLFFTSYDQAHGQELWKSDGTAAGTQMVKDINPGSNTGVSESADLTCFKGMVFFKGDDNIHADEVWYSDGTASGTKMLRNINERPGYSSYPQSFTAVGDHLYFVATNERFGRELYKTDGSSSGTEIVKDIYPGGYGALNLSYPDKIQQDGSSLFFQAYEPEHGSELWSSRGLPGNTSLLSDLDTSSGTYSPNSSRPENITDVEGFICFTSSKAPFADTGEFCVIGKNGQNLRKFDLRSNGYSFPLNLKEGLGMVFFSADDGVNGRELWVFEPNTSEVTSFSLVDPIDDQDIKVLEQNEVINLTSLNHKPINIRANLLGSSSVGSVVFKLNDSIFKVENAAPYALAGDKPTGDYHKWHPQPGTYLINATPYSGSNGTGEPGVSYELSFIIAEVDFGITHFTLVHSDSDQDLLNIEATPYPNSFFGSPQIIDLTGISDPHRINIRANTHPAVVDKVNFYDFNIEYSRIESVPPYALFGDKNGDYKPWPVPLAGEIGKNFLAAVSSLGSKTDTADTYMEFVYSDIEVTGISLYDADSDEFIRNIQDGDAIDIQWLSTNRVNIIANTVPEQVGSVVFSVDGTAINYNTCCRYVKNENEAPYTLFGDRSGDLNGWNIQTGTINLIAYPMTEAQTKLNEEKRGVTGGVLRMGFSFYDSSNPGTKSSRLSQSAYSSFDIYPNPTTGYCTINIPAGMEGPLLIQIFDISQSLEYETQIDHIPDNNQLEMDLRSYEHGLYLVKISGRKTNFTSKLIIL